MSILDYLLDESKWAEFLQYKIEKSHLSKCEEQALVDFVIGKKYYDIADGIKQGTYTFSLPTKSFINKTGSNKKRVVYTYEYNESVVLKFVLYLMDKYDQCFAQNCYSFRKNCTVKKAFFNILSTSNIDNLYAYKLDISNYFNTIDIEQLLPMLQNVLFDDNKLYNFIKSILTVDASKDVDGNIISEKRGAMAGTCLSTFLANVYLMDLDKYFFDNNITYARYSDDIIIFADSKEKLEVYKQHILTELQAKNLQINPNKESMFLPGQTWSFLGFEYGGGNIDLSMITVKKIKDKIRRKARALYRWRTKNNKTAEHATKVLLRIFNNKFYRETNTKDLTWSKWFFPVINTHKSLKIIDEYLVQYIRYLQTGKFSKKNYNLTYEQIKQYGFRSLVNEYHKFVKINKAQNN